MAEGWQNDNLLIILITYQSFRVYYIFPSRYDWRPPKWRLTNWFPAFKFYKDLADTGRSFYCLYGHDIHYFGDVTILKN